MPSSWDKAVQEIQKKNHHSDTAISCTYCVQCESHVELSDDKVGHCHSTMVTGCQAQCYVKSEVNT